MYFVQRSDSNQLLVTSPGTHQDYTLDNLIIQTSHQRSAPYTNLYIRTKRCYWLDSKIFSQPELRNLSTPIKQPIACIQIQTGSLVIILFYIFNCLMITQTDSSQKNIFKAWLNICSLQAYSIQETFYGYID